MWEEHRLRVPENRVLRRIFYLRGRKGWKVGEDYIIRSLYTSPHIITISFITSPIWVPSVCISPLPPSIVGTR